MMNDTPFHQDENNVVILNYNLLVAHDTNYSRAIETAFGSHPECLGILLVKNVPNLSEKRERLLNLASFLANLPKPILNKVHDPITEWIGWDQGTELFNGRPDLAKGSYYANPYYDIPEIDPDIISKFPSLSRPNLWLPDDLPELEPAFKDLAQLIVQVGILIAHQVDLYANSHDIQEYPSPTYLEQAMKLSRTHKGRLLHYYPLNTVIFPETHTTTITDIDNLCGFHMDHSSITGLTSALYVNETIDSNTGELINLQPVTTPPNDDAGLYIRTRGGNLIKVTIPHDCIAYQIGEALQLSTRGRLQATWHCVSSGSNNNDNNKNNIARNTLAVFCQPNLNDFVTPTMTFAEFSTHVYSRNHAS